jgi:hypothetical protein
MSTTMAFMRFRNLLSSAHYVPGAMPLRKEGFRVCATLDTGGFRAGQYEEVELFSFRPEELPESRNDAMFAIGAKLEIWKSENPGLVATLYMYPNSSDEQTGVVFDALEPVLQR